MDQYSRGSSNKGGSKYSAEINTDDYIISSASGETVPAFSACGVATSLTYGDGSSGDTYFQSVDSTPSRASSWRSTTIPVVAPPYYNLVNNCESFSWSSSSFGDLRGPMLRATRSTEWISSTLTYRQSIQAATGRCPPTPSRTGAMSSLRPTPPRLANQAQALSSVERYRLLQTSSTPRFLAGMQATVVGIRTSTATAVSLCRSPSSSTSTTTRAAAQPRPQAQSRSTPAGR